jgi:hypothetical protein
MLILNNNLKPSRRKRMTMRMIKKFLLALRPGFTPK